MTGPGEADLETTELRPVLDVRNLTTQVATSDGAKTIIDDVSVLLRPEETLCIAGESGSGKSITSLSIMGLLPPSARVTGGEILLNGRNLLTLDEREMQSVRGGDIAMIFQEPMTSLNPIMTVGAQLAEAIGVHNDIHGAARPQEGARVARCGAHVGERAQARAVSA